jgi:hypothetical protein
LEQQHLISKIEIKNQKEKNHKLKISTIYNNVEEQNAT